MRYILIVAVLGWGLNACGESDSPGGEALATSDSSAAAVDAGTTSAEPDASSSENDDAVETAADGSEDPAGSDATSPEGDARPEESGSYEDMARWLCHPDEPSDYCATDLDVTNVLADGSTEVLPFQVNDAPAVDCFYVYPTASSDPTPNSDFEVGEEEIFAAQNQVARLGSHCRVFAPIYRQVTLTALFDPTMAADRELAYNDVKDAFTTYLEQHNDGRGIVFIGHSQGAGVLTRLLTELFDGKALQDQLVSAYLIGSAVSVPVGEDVGGSFQSIPLCREADQAGCVISYATYRETEPPGATGIFGKVDAGEAACTNPADLTGAKASLTPYMPTRVTALVAQLTNAGMSPFADPDTAPELETGFFGLPGLLEGECVTRDGAHYLEISVLADPSDGRADDIGGDFTDGWGLHLVDISLAMGDIEALVGRQIEVYSAK